MADRIISAMPTSGIAYSLIADRHPEQVEEIISRLRLGKSRHNLALREELTWSYEFCWGSKPVPAKPRHQMTEDEEVALDCARLSHLVLIGKIGRWWKAEKIAGVPPEVEAIVRHSVREEREHRRKYEEAHA